MGTLIAPSILSADFGNLQKEVEMLNGSVADWIHCDIMDGVFVPNISFGRPIMLAITNNSQKPLDIHLMLTNPDPYIPHFQFYNTLNITIHYEACKNLSESIQLIKNLGIKAGVAINPDTPVEVLAEYLPSIDLVCLMSVHPGFGGQQFILKTYSKLQKLKALCNEVGSKALIEIDGGVTLGNAGELKKFGADVLVAGNSVFGFSNPSQMIETFKNTD